MAIDKLLKFYLVIAVRGNFSVITIVLLNIFLVTARLIIRCLFVLLVR